jgi:hypothetical protein
MCKQVDLVSRLNGLPSGAVSFFILALTGLAACNDPPGPLGSDEPALSDVAESVVVGDLNGDNLNDIALGYTVVGGEGYTNGFASVILRDSGSTGGFRRSVDAELGLSKIPWSIVATDLEGSGADDVVIALGANGLRVYEHNEKSSGPLARATNIDYIGVPFGLAAADLDGDGAVDIAATGSDRFAADGLILFWQNPLQRGSFSRADTTLPTANNATGLAIADMNGDGRLDVVVSSRAASAGVVSIHLQAEMAERTFLPRTDFTVGTSPESLTLADLNSDGLTDVAVANRSADAATSIMVLLQDVTRPGVLLEPISYSSAPWSRAIAAGDVNGDGRIDLVVTHTADSARSISVLLQNDVQAGTFALAADYSVNCKPKDVAIEDMNGDQLPDIVLACGERATLLYNISGIPGTFSSPVSVGK